jgi:beta-lactamase regulating signal transducer with metallopeptidase domain
VTALVLAVGCLLAGSLHAARLVAQQRRVDRELPRPSAGDLVVVPGDQPAAFAVSGWHHARIIITTALFDVLADPAQREAVIEHERSHLRHHHLLLRCVTEVAARLNPLLRPVVAVVNDATERWADEDAARHVGPESVARALLTVALAGAATSPGLVSPLTGGQVPQRVQCLLEPPARHRWAAGLLVMLVLVSLAAFGAMTLDVDVAEDIITAASHLGR